MRVRLKLKPGQRGTRKLLAQYGDRLVCVRYRYDAVKKKRYKTVELIVDVGDWEPPPSLYEPQTVVHLRPVYGNPQLVQAIQRAGGRWHPHLNMWTLVYERVLSLGLQDLIVRPR